MRQVKFLVALVLALALAGVAARAEDRKDSKDNKLTGKWTVTDVNKSGKREEDVKGKTVTITGDTIKCCDKDSKCEMEARYTLDTSSKPYRITMKCTEGEHKGKTLEGIVDMDGDTARICFSKPDEKAPTSTRETKQGQCCITLRRAESR